MKKILCFSLLLFAIGSFATLNAQNNNHGIQLTKQHKLINKGEPIALYKYNHPAHSAKEAGNYTTRYFYQIDSAGAILPLTKENLKRSTPSSHKFHEELDAQFKSDSDLAAYDTFHKMYKLNWLYKRYVSKE